MHMIIFSTRLKTNVNIRRTRDVS